MFTTLSVDDTLKELNTSINGINESEANKRILKYGLNKIDTKKSNILGVFIGQFKTNPLIIILALATFISFSLGDHTSSYYIFAMIFLSVGLGTWNEYSAEHTVEKLLKKIAATSLIERDGKKIEIEISKITIGDIVYLSEGAIIPADLRLLEIKNLEINEASLTGESKPVYKTIDALEKEPSSINENTNIAFMGTAVESGSGKGIVIRLAKDTEFGKITQNVSFVKPTTEFEKGLFDFGKLIVKIILILAVGIFLVNSILGHNLLESLLFALAIAVGLTPELLPVIVTVSLSHGAGKLAKKHVIAKRLISLENLGNMDILCTDKTGTLTEGKIKIVDIEGSDTLENALLCNDAINHHKIIGNAIDVAIWEHANSNNISIPKNIKKIEQDSFDFQKKAMYSIIEENSRRFLLVKGAADVILDKCIDLENKTELINKIHDLNKDGLRVVAIAKKQIEEKQNYGWEDFNNMQYLGYLTFLDIPKPSANAALKELRNLNVDVKLITGDNEIVSQKICNEVGMSITKIVLGSEMDEINDEEFRRVVLDTNLFARVNPEQKLRIIQTLQSLGHTVGFMGDGINDAPSLHAADVGISVNTAVDVAKEAASIVLLKSGLNIIKDGIMEGRKTFNNTIKYILMSTSSNFGNMFSAAGASFFLPFLPMSAAQILLTNGLYDISQLSIPSDNVDKESMIKPRHWNIGFIKQYMLFFGPISSIYDFLTFGVMIFIFHATGKLFQTGWFIESIATEILVVFIIRTSVTPFYKSRPSKWLLITCLTMVGIGILLPFTLLGQRLGLVIPPTGYYIALIFIVLTYLALVSIMKRLFLKKYTL